MSTPTIDAVYYGPRDAMIAEVSTPDYYAGRYLIQIVGDGTWDADGTSNLREAKKMAKALAKTLNVKAILVS